MNLLGFTPGDLVTEYAIVLTNSAGNRKVAYTCATKWVTANAWAHRWANQLRQDEQDGWPFSDWTVVEVTNVKTEVAL